MGRAASGLKIQYYNAHPSARDINSPIWIKDTEYDTYDADAFEESNVFQHDVYFFV
jgi:hypothetical protein